MADKWAENLSSNISGETNVPILYVELRKRKYKEKCRADNFFIQIFEDRASKKVCIEIELPTFISVNTVKRNNCYVDNFISRNRSQRLFYN